MPKLIPAALFAFTAALIGAAAPSATFAQQKQKTFPKGVWLDPDKSEPAGTKYQTFTSKSLGSDVSYLVYLPPGYDKENSKRYPVVYWLHGLGGNQRGGALSFVGRLNAAIRDGSVPPAVVVLVNGMVKSWYCDWATGNMPMESVIVKDLIPHVDKTYRTIATREGRVVQGFSMGGFGAGHLGFKYPELFGTVVVDAGALLLADTAFSGPLVSATFKEAFGDKEKFQAEHPNTLAEKNADKLRSKTNIRVGVGTKDNLLPRNKALHELLDKLKIEHEYDLAEGVGHNAGDYYKTLGTQCFAIHKKAFEAAEKAK